jgi:signal peptidase I
MNGQEGKPSDPWLAAGLSILVPGLGQLYAGRPGRAAFFFTGSVISLAGLVSWIMSETRMNLLEGTGWFAALIAFEPGSWLDAWLYARRQTPGIPADTASRTAALSALFPGLGHVFLLCRRWHTRLISAPFLLAPALLLTVVDALEAPPVEGWPRVLMRWPWWLTLSAGTLLSATAITHGWYFALGRTGRPNRRPGFSTAIWILAVSAWAVGQLPWESWLKERVQSFKIPSGSMEPGLQIGDRIWAKRVREIMRGDIVVFRPPDVPDQDYIKRVVGLPEERLELRNNKVYINGLRLNEPYAVFRPGRPLMADFGPVRVPQGGYFVMGDNRDNSRDSRFFGFVPRASVYGRAYKRFWPWRRVGPLK